VVDRNIIKLKSFLRNRRELDKEIKTQIIKSINETMNKKYQYNGKKLSLQSIMQRQVYRLSGAFCNRSIIKVIFFKW
jgi:CRISPR-associated protein Cas1